MFKYNFRMTIALILVTLFIISYECHLFYSITKIYNKKKEGITSEEINRNIAKQIERGWLYLIMGAICFLSWLIFHNRLINTPVIHNFLLIYSGLSLLVGMSQLIAYYLARKW